MKYSIHQFARSVAIVVFLGMLFIEAGLAALPSLLLQACERVAAERNEDASTRFRTAEEEISFQQEALRNAKKSIEEMTEVLANPSRDEKGQEAIGYQYRGAAYLVTKQHDLAYKDLSESLSLDSRLPAKLCVLRSRALLGMGKYREALEDANVATMPGPFRSTGYAIRAMILSYSADPMVRNPKKALDSAKMAKLFHDKADWKETVLICRAFAMAYSANGDFESAVKQQFAAIEAVQGKVPLDYKKELEAYKVGKMAPIPW